MIKINLVAEGKKPAAVRRVKAQSSPGARKEDLAQWMFAATLIAALLGVGSYWWFLNNQLKTKEREISQAQTEVKRLEEIIKEVEGYKQKKGELEHKIAVIQDLKENQRGPVRVMDEISRSLPELLWLTSLDMNSNTIKMKGQSFNLNAVATFLDNLDRVPEFQEPELQDSKREGEVYSFQLQIAYKPVPPGAPPAAGADGSGGGAAPPTTAPTGQTSGTRTGG
ncbi:MAG: PilN domain-containing protein [Thermoanaerobaculia bacterium]